MSAFLEFLGNFQGSKYIVFAPSSLKLACPNQCRFSNILSASSSVPAKSGLQNGTASFFSNENSAQITIAVSPVRDRKRLWRFRKLSLLLLCISNGVSPVRDRKRLWRFRKLSVVLV